MQYSKLLCLLLLLITSNMATAFPTINNGVKHFTEVDGFSDLYEEQHEISNCSLSAPVTVPASPLKFSPAHFNFYFFSAYRETQCENYIGISKTIDPALGIAEIIFPFHSFL